jgi:hypothetical protein
MVLLEADKKIRAVYEFGAEIEIFDENIEPRILRSNYEPIINT